MTNTKAKVYKNSGYQLANIKWEVQDHHKTNLFADQWKEHSNFLCITGIQISLYVLWK
jgi:hypothetical protein